MRTIIIGTDNFLPRTDGISRFLQSLLPALEDFKVIIIAPNFKGKFVKNGNYEIHRIPVKKMVVGDFPVPESPKNIDHIIEKADLVFTQTLGPVIGGGVVDPSSAF
jgi:hypothetical protein